MVDLLSITDSLSRDLERMEQNNVEAMSLIMDMKDKLWLIMKYFPGML